MSQHDQASEVAPTTSAESATKKPFKLDLKKYKTRELVERLIELFGLSNAFWKIATTSLYAIIAMLVVFALIEHLTNLTGLSWIMFGAYSLVIGAVFGFVSGILRIIYGALENTEGILCILVENSDKALQDVSKLRSGEMEMPSGQSIITQMHEDVLIPSIETAISETIGILGAPVLWIYKRSIGMAVKRIVRLASRSPEDSQAIQKAQENAVELLVASQMDESERSFLIRVRKIIGSIGNGLRNYAILPFFFAFCFLMLLALLPMLIYTYFFFGAVPPIEIPQAEAVLNFLMLVMSR